LAEWDYLRQYITSDDIDPYRHDFDCPRGGYLNPKEEAATANSLMSSPVSSPRRIHAEMGMSFERVARERIEDMFMLISMAQEKVIQLKSLYPDIDVKWQNLICGPVVTGITTSISESEAIQPQKAGGEE
jgi:hypothetical protein